MKYLFYSILAVLVFLAVSSGITKIMLMQQDVDFFGQYGFTNPILIGFGIIQLVGGVMLVPPRTRVNGASMVAVTFLISAMVLFMAGAVPIALVTLFCTGLLGYVIQQSRLTTD